MIVHFSLTVMPCSTRESSTSFVTQMNFFVRLAAKRSKKR